VDAGKYLKVAIETSRVQTKVRLCFDRKIGENGRCFTLNLESRGIKKRKIPMTRPKIYYEER